MIAKLAVGITLALMLVQESRKGYFRNFKSYLGEISWRPYAGILAVFLILFPVIFFQDQRVLSFIQTLDNSFWQGILWVGRNVGENVKFWILLVGFYWVSRLLGSEKGSSCAMGTIAASSLAGILAHFFKFVFMRTRPYENAGPYSFFNYYEILHHPRPHQSLPSGDVALVSGAIFFFIFSIRHPGLRFLALLVPPANAFARMSLNRHWPSDTLMGLALGFTAAFFFWQFKEYQRKRLKPFSSPGVL